MCIAKRVNVLSAWVYLQERYRGNSCLYACPCSAVKNAKKGPRERAKETAEYRRC